MKNSTEEKLLASIIEEKKIINEILKLLKKRLHKTFEWLPESSELKQENPNQRIKKTINLANICTKEIEALNKKDESLVKMIKALKNYEQNGTSKGCIHEHFCLNQKCLQKEECE